MRRDDDADACGDSRPSTKPASKGGMRRAGNEPQQLDGAPSTKPASKGGMRRLTVGADEHKRLLQRSPPAKAGCDVALAAATLHSSRLQRSPPAKAGCDTSARRQKRYSGPFNEARQQRRDATANLQLSGHTAKIRGSARTSLPCARPSAFYLSRWPQAIDPLRLSMRANLSMFPRSLDVRAGTGRAHPSTPP